MQVEAAVAFFIEKMERELPAYLSYHNVDHTLRVMQHAAEIAAAEGITGEHLDKLRTAAALHDTGFIEKYAGHEEVSCRLAKEFLPQFDYTGTQIEDICELIRATKMP